MVWSRLGLGSNAILHPLEMGNSATGTEKLT